MNDIALANVAWCATRGDRYPPTMLNTCFERHTAPLFQALEPDVVLLSGTHLRRFAEPEQCVVPRALVIPMRHYAHRGGREIELAELARVRALLEPEVGVHKTS